MKATIRVMISGDLEVDVPDHIYEELKKVIPCELGQLTETVSSALEECVGEQDLEAVTVNEYMIVGISLPVTPKSEVQ